MAPTPPKSRGIRALGSLAPARISQLLGIVITTVACVLFLASQREEFEVPLLDQLELKIYDLRLRSLEPARPRHVTIAAIDEQSLARVGRWPWSRTVHAELAKQLDEAGAKVIAFDIFFSERESPKADAQLARAIGANKKTVLSTVFLVHPREVRYLSEARLKAGLEAIEPQAIAKAVGRKPGQEVLGVLANIPELQTGALYAGHINVQPDADGLYRRVPLVILHDGRYFPSSDVQVARAFYPDQDFSLEVASFGVVGMHIAGRHIPLDEQGHMLVRFRGKAGTFDTVSISDILERKVDPALLRDRVILVGGMAAALGDIRATPYDKTTQGVELRANVIENLIDGTVIERPDWMALVDAVAMALVGLLLVWLLPRFGVSGGGLLAGTLFAAYVVLAVLLFRSEGLWLNIVYPSLLIVALFASATLVHYFFRVSEQRYLKRAFAHYVPPAVVDDLVADAGKLQLGGEKRELTVLFSDIRGFTTLSEAMAPEDLVKLMNEYFTVMTGKVFEHRGSLDKYIGDAIMAVFGAPVAEPGHAALACRAALDMVRALRAFQQSLRQRGLPAIDIGIGINTGPMVVGNMGSASRFNYTVVGDAVNLASRIEHLNKEYATNILVSEYTYLPVKDEFPLAREVDRVRVRGRAQPVQLFELFTEGRSATLDWLDEYRAAYAVMREGDAARAAAMFAALHARTGDGVSGFHALHCASPQRRRVDETIV